MSFLFFQIYKWLLSPLAWLLLQISRPFLRGKVREMIDDKNEHYREMKAGELSARPIWIHAASGEIEYARPLIRELKQRYPQIPLLVTYSSPSAKKILRQISEIDAWTALPWDIPGAYTEFFKFWKPRFLLVARTDLWPLMAEQTARQNIPAVLFSATFADNSSRLHGVSKFLTLFSLNQLREIFCVAENDLRNVERLSLRTPIRVLGDTRFDQVLHRLQNPRPLHLKTHPADFTFVMGSTWPQDEAVLLPALPELKKIGLKFILAPHEIAEDHLLDLEENLKSQGMTWVRFSRAESWEKEDVLLLDQIGILAELYTWGDTAFVGGSFKKQVHSVMEPLAAGLPVLVGPHHLNNREAIDMQKVLVGATALVREVKTSEDVVNAIRQIQSQSRAELRRQIVAEIEKRTGATASLLEKIKPDLV